MLKNILYIKANAKLHTKWTINQTSDNKNFNNGFAWSLSDHVTDQRAAKVQNNRATTQIQTINQINIFQKNDHNEISLGALSNIATSGFSNVFWFCVGSAQSCALQIVGMLPRFGSNSVIINTNI